MSEREREKEKEKERERERKSERRKKKKKKNQQQSFFFKKENTRFSSPHLTTTAHHLSAAPSNLPFFPPNQSPQFSYLTPRFHFWPFLCTQLLFPPLSLIYSSSPPRWGPVQKKKSHYVEVSKQRGARWRGERKEREREREREKEEGRERER